MANTKRKGSMLVFLMLVLVIAMIVAQGFIFSASQKQEEKAIQTSLSIGQEFENLKIDLQKLSNYDNGNSWPSGTIDVATYEGLFPSEIGTPMSRLFDGFGDIIESITMEFSFENSDVINHLTGIASTVKVKKSVKLSLSIPNFNNITVYPLEKEIRNSIKFNGDVYWDENNKVLNVLIMFSKATKDQYQFN